MDIDFKKLIKNSGVTLWVRSPIDNRQVLDPGKIRISSKNPSGHLSAISSITIVFSSRRIETFPQGSSSPFGKAME